MRAPSTCTSRAPSASAPLEYGMRCAGGYPSAKFGSGASLRTLPAGSSAAMRSAVSLARVRVLTWSRTCASRPSSCSAPRSISAIRRPVAVACCLPSGVRVCSASRRGKASSSGMPKSRSGTPAGRERARERGLCSSYWPCRTRMMRFGRRSLPSRRARSRTSSWSASQSSGSSSCGGGERSRRLGGAAAAASGLSVLLPKLKPGIGRRPAATANVAASTHRIALRAGMPP
mmetsp:Transcript_23722/g.77513  ORF Transcript_23722/g.77513 Transcript_23722/m.77513 type:complete len:231 (+) Transcript_23722:287-979(+)